MRNQKTCAELVQQELKDREAQIEEFYDRIETAEQAEQWDEADQARDELSEFPLGINTYRVLRIDLSTGGPGDWLEAKLIQQKHYFEVEALTYHYADWFDHAETQVSSDSPLWKLAEYYAEMEEASHEN